MKFRILLRDKVDETLLRDIKNKHGLDIEGIGELYDSLIINGSCDSYEPSKIYYVAYTLALSSLNLIIVQVN